MVKRGVESIMKHLTYDLMSEMPSEESSFCVWSA
jgi:hypothetical protein